MARKKVDAEQARTLPDEIVAKIRADLATWKAGNWAAQLRYGPACTCGLRTAETCPRHPNGTSTQRSNTSQQPTETK